MHQTLYNLHQLLSDLITGKYWDTSPDQYPLGDLLIHLSRIPGWEVKEEQTGEFEDEPDTKTLLITVPRSAGAHPDQDQAINLVSCIMALISQSTAGNILPTIQYSTLPFDREDKTITHSYHIPYLHYGS